MNKTFKQTFFKSFAFFGGAVLGLGFISRAFAVDAVTQSEMDDVRYQLEHAAKQPRIYRGNQAATIDDGAGTFCEKERSYSFNWQGQVGEVAVAIASSGEAQMRLGFQDSMMDVSGYRKGGLVCIWEGGAARLAIKNIAIDFSLAPEEKDQEIKIDVSRFWVNGINFSRIDLSLPFFSIENGSIPDWLNHQIEKTFDREIAPAVLATFRRQIDHLLAQKIYALIKNIQKNGVQP